MGPPMKPASPCGSTSSSRITARIHSAGMKISRPPGVPLRASPRDENIANAQPAPIPIEMTIRFIVLRRTPQVRDRR